jgi:hypothetical protein
MDAVSLLRSHHRVGIPKQSLLGKESIVRLSGLVTQQGLLGYVLGLQSLLTIKSE